MAVYLVEIPNNSPREYTREDVEKQIREIFEYADVTVQLKHSGSLKNLDWDEEYAIAMAAG